MSKNQANQILDESLKESKRQLELVLAKREAAGEDVSEIRVKALEILERTVKNLKEVVRDKIRKGLD